MYIRIGALLLVDIFVNLRNMCLEIYKLDPADFLSASRLAWQAALKKKKNKMKLDLLTDTDVINTRKMY